MKLCARCSLWIWDLILSEVPKVTKDKIIGGMGDPFWGYNTACSSVLGWWVKCAGRCCPHLNGKDLLHCRLSIMSSFLENFPRGVCRNRKSRVMRVAVRGRYLQELYQPCDSNWSQEKPISQPTLQFSFSIPFLNSASLLWRVGPWWLTGTWSSLRR